MARSRVKRNSILNFVAVAIITVIGIVLSVCSFDIPFTNYTYNGFANSISLGLDLAGGISVVYECDDSAVITNLDEAMDATVTRLTNTITAEYSEATIMRQGTTKIRIEVPSVTDADVIFDMIGQPKPLHMTYTKGIFDEKTDIMGSDIEDVQVSYRKGSSGEYEPGVSIKFTKEGATKFANLTGKVVEDGTNEIHIYLGEVSDDNFFQTLTCEQKIVGDSTFISGGAENPFTYEQAQEYAMQIMSGTYEVPLKLVEKSVVSATLGTEALKLAIIGGFVGLVLIMLIMWWRYGDFGLLAGFALIMYLVLMLFFLQAISFVQLTLPGLAGIILSIGMAVDGTVIIFERFREEYKSGKKIPLAVKSGFKRAFWPIFDSNITTILTAIVLYILGTASIQGFAITLLIGIVLSMFMNLVILRFLVKWYLPFNSVKGKKLHLPKQVRVVKEDVAVEGGQAND